MAAEKVLAILEADSHTCAKFLFLKPTFVFLWSTALLLPCLVYDLLLGCISPAGSWPHFTDVWHVLLCFLFM